MKTSPRFSKQKQIYIINIYFNNPILKYAPLPALCLAVQQNAKVASSLTPGSKSSKHLTSVSVLHNQLLLELVEETV